MKIVQAPCQTEELIKKSRFIGLIYPCASEALALNQLKQLHLEHPNASHIVYAYRIRSADGLICRFNDAGEPSGTAGKPIYQHLEGKQLLDTLLAVVRYFGGVKLGAGGLTRAYSQLAKQVIALADTCAFVPMMELDITLDYSHLQALSYQLKQLDGVILSQTFADTVQLRIQLPQAQHLALQPFLNDFALAIR